MRSSLGSRELSAGVSVFNHKPLEKLDLDLAGADTRLQPSHLRGELRKPSYQYHHEN